MLNIPSKLPMIIKPKAYNKNVYGGYLLNNDKYHEDLFIEKKNYATTSVLSDDNNIYDTVNKISATPFKINTDFLDYILNEGVKHKLLLDPLLPHKFAHIENKTRYQQSVYASHNSKVVLQETILGGRV